MIFFEDNVFYRLGKSNGVTAEINVPLQPSKIVRSVGSVKFLVTATRLFGYSNQNFGYSS